MGTGVRHMRMLPPTPRDWPTGWGRWGNSGDPGTPILPEGEGGGWGAAGGRGRVKVTGEGDTDGGGGNMDGGGGRGPKHLPLCSRPAALPWAAESQTRVPEETAEKTHFPHPTSVRMRPDARAEAARPARGWASAWCPPPPGPACRTTTADHRSERGSCFLRPCLPHATCDPRPPREAAPRAVQGRNPRQRDPRCPGDPGGPAGARPHLTRRPSVRRKQPRAAHRGAASPGNAGAGRASVFQSPLATRAQATALPDCSSKLGVTRA